MTQRASQHLVADTSEGGSEQRTLGLDETGGLRQDGPDDSSEYLIANSWGVSPGSPCEPKRSRTLKPVPSQNNALHPLPWDAV